VIAKILEEAGADILDITAGGRRDKVDKTGEGFYSAHRSLPRDYMPDGVNVYIMKAIKKEKRISWPWGVKSFMTPTFPGKSKKEGRRKLSPA
jgi:hypothetical protein